MIANSRCIACNLSKKEEKIRKHSDEKKKKEFIQKVTGILYKYGDIESTPMLDKRIQDIYNEYYEEETDYVALKHKYNQYMLEREDEIKEHLKEAKNIKDYIKLDIENPIIRINTAFKGCSSLEKISVLPRIYHN